jgi:hypothetical protein
MMSIACRESLGAIHNLWREQNHWQIALLFMLTILIAQWTVNALSHRRASFMGDGSHLICLVLSRVGPTAAIGKGLQL